MKLKVKAKQTGSHDCVVCGMENPDGLHAQFYSMEDDSCVALFHFNKRNQSYPNRVHGGMICAILDERSPWTGHRHEELVAFVQDRPGHDFRYAIDPAKIERELGWRPEVNFADGIRRTVEWYLAQGRALLGLA